MVRALVCCFDLDSSEDAISRLSRCLNVRHGGARFLVAAVVRDSRSTKIQIVMEISGMTGTEFSAVSPQISHALIASLSFHCGAPVNARPRLQGSGSRRKFETSRCNYVTLGSPATCNRLSAIFFAISGAVRSGVAAEKSQGVAASTHDSVDNNLVTWHNELMDAAEQSAVRHDIGLLPWEIHVSIAAAYRDCSHRW